MRQADVPPGPLHGWCLGHGREEDDFWIGQFPASICLKALVGEALSRPKDALKIHGEDDDDDDQPPRGGKRNKSEDLQHSYCHAGQQTGSRQNRGSMRYSPWSTHGRQRGYLIKTLNVYNAVGFALCFFLQLAIAVQTVPVPRPASATIASAVGLGGTLQWWSAGSTAAIATVREVSEVVDFWLDG